MKTFSIILHILFIKFNKMLAFVLVLQWQYIQKYNYHAQNLT